MGSAKRDARPLVIFFFAIALALSAVAQNAPTPPPIPAVSDIHQGFILLRTGFLMATPVTTIRPRALGNSIPKDSRRRRIGAITGVVIWLESRRSWRI